MPSPLALLKWIDHARSLLSDADSIQRVTRLYEKQPLIEKAYSPQAIARAVEYSPEGQITLLHPEEFKGLSLPLDSTMAAPYVDHYKDLIQQQKWVEPPPGLFMEHYLSRMREKLFDGFSDVPFLQYKQDPLSPVRGQILGHEGRHRMRALDQLFPDEKFPVKFQGDLPKRPYFVYPQGSSLNSPPLDLSKSPRLAGGGLVKGALSLLKEVTHNPKSSQRAKDLLYPKVAPRQVLSDDARIITNEMMHHSEVNPTTLFHDGNNDLKSAYQITPRKDGTYLPYMVSYEKGLGSPTLEHAYQSSPQKPVYLYAIPNSEGFYRKQPGWEESIEDGISKFTKKFQGGSV